MATIKEVAKASNVSIATVSNILNGKGRVSEATRQKVLDTSKKMEYIPNMMAKTLKQKSSRTVGIITEDLTVFNCADIVDGINEYLEENNYNFLLGNLRLYKKYDNTFYHHENYGVQVEEEFRIMRSKQVDGIIYVGAHCHEIQSIPSNYEVPIVVAYGYATRQHIQSVVFDDEQGAYEAVDALIHCGHTRIGAITGEVESLHTINRIRGYQKALFEHKILCNPSMIVTGDWSRDSGYHACKELMRQDASAIFVMNDIMAAGVYDYLIEMGLEIGKDVSIIGFDNREICTAFCPALSTMALPLSEIGRKAAKILLHMLQGNENIELKETKEKQETLGIHRIPCTYIKRQSIGQMTIE